jgi:hypothetical protein
MRTTRGKRNLSSGAARRLINLKALLDRWRDAYRTGRKTQQIEAQPVTSDGDARPTEPPPLPDDRSEALATLCDRFLEELGGSEIKAAEIRFVVHKRDDPARPPEDPDRDSACGEVAWELRRLIASAGDTLADAVRGLERHAADLDENGRELLQDELTTLDVDLSLLKEHLADPTDWDSELECLLAGEIGPFDDPRADEEDDDDE